MDLQQQPSLAARCPVGVDQAAQMLEVGVDCDQPVRPGCAPAGRWNTHGRAEQRRRVLRPGPYPRPVDADQPVVAYLLATQQRTDDVDAFPQPIVAYLFAGPASTGDVLVTGLARAKCSPKSAGIHAAQGADGLGDHGRVVALARRGNNPNGSALACRAAPSHDQANPAWPCRSLHGEEWSEDIAASKPASSARCTAASSSLG